MIPHFLITRWNVVSPFGLKGINLNKEWLQNRIQLFNQYTYPSVAGQIGAENTVWLLCVDERTPSGLLPYLPRGPIGPSGIKVLHILCPSSRERWKDGLREFLRQSPDDVVMTTRLDSDDALSSKFCKATRDLVEGNRYQSGCYDFPSGLSFQSLHETICRQIIDYAAHATALSPFFTMVERRSPASPILTALGVDHGVQKRNGPTVLDSNFQPAWLQVIHGSNQKNVAGTVIERRPIVVRHILEQFSVTLS